MAHTLITRSVDSAEPQAELAAAAAHYQQATLQQWQLNITFIVHKYYIYDGSNLQAVLPAQ